MPESKAEKTRSCTGHEKTGPSQKEGVKFYCADVPLRCAVNSVWGGSERQSVRYMGSKGDGGTTYRCTVGKKLGTVILCSNRLGGEVLSVYEKNGPSGQGAFYVGKEQTQSEHGGPRHVGFEVTLEETGKGAL